MNDVQVQRFLKLTESNLQNAVQSNEVHLTESKGYKLRLGLLCLFIVSIVLIHWQGHKPIRFFPWFNLHHLNFVHPKKHPQAAAQIRLVQAPVLKSHIPSLHIAAVQQFLQPVPLKRAELLFQAATDIDEIPATMVVMDQVIVMPKKLLSDVKQVA